MLEKEVIEILQKGMDELGQYGGELTIAYETAIGALNKQMPKRPYTSVIPYPYKRDETMVQCPACRRRLRTRRTMAKGDKFCPSCGQHIDWEGIDG